MKNNLLFGLPLDEERYREAVRVSQLQPDLDLLPHGDRTLPCYYYYILRYLTGHVFT